MKSITVVVLTLILAAFISKEEQKPLPLKLSSVSKKIINPAIPGQRLKDQCRVAFILNPSTTDTANVEVRSCEGKIYGITVNPGSYVSSDCLSTDYGVVVLQGNVVVDWMQMCP